MKGIALAIETFLQMKNRTWHERELYDYRKNVIRTARDEDFRGERLYELCLRKENGIVIQRAMLISRFEFIIFDEGKKEVEANFTPSWQRFLEKNRKLFEEQKKQEQENKQIEKERII